MFPRGLTITWSAPHSPIPVDTNNDWKAYTVNLIQTALSGAFINMGFSIDPVNAASNGTERMHITATTLNDYNSLSEAADVITAAARGAGVNLDTSGLQFSLVSNINSSVAANAGQIVAPVVAPVSGTGTMYDDPILRVDDNGAIPFDHAPPIFQPPTTQVPNDDIALPVSLPVKGTTTSTRPGRVPTRQGGTVVAPVVHPVDVAPPTPTGVVPPFLVLPPTQDDTVPPIYPTDSANVGAPTQTTTPAPTVVAPVVAPVVTPTNQTETTTPAPTVVAPVVTETNTPTPTTAAAAAPATSLWAWAAAIGVGAWLLFAGHGKK